MPKLNVVRPIVFLALLAMLGALIAGCVPLPPLEEAWTPPPVTQAVATAVPPTATSAPTATAVPTEAPTFTPAPTATTAAAVAAATRVPTRAATVAPTRTATARPTATATAGPRIFTITEKDIAQAVAGGSAADQGLRSENLQVRFTGGKIYVTADSLAYGPVNLRNLNLVGQLVAQNGAMQMQIESISPRGLFTAMIPNVANQALAQLTAGYYVDKVQVLEGRVEVTFR